LNDKKSPDLIFCTSYFEPYIFKVLDPKKISGQPDELDIRVQIDWSNDSTTLQSQLQSCDANG
jgi:hypothetical protein